MRPARAALCTALGCDALRSEEYLRKNQGKDATEEFEASHPTDIIKRTLTKEQHAAMWGARCLGGGVGGPLMGAATQAARRH